MWRHRRSRTEPGSKNFVAAICIRAWGAWFRLGTRPGWTRSRYALALLLPSYPDTELSSPTEPALVLYDSVLSDVTHVIKPFLVSLYAIVTVRMILREEYGIPGPLLSL